MQTPAISSSVTYKLLAFSLLALLISIPQSAWAKRLFVTNNAIDSSTCGSRSEPCRSLSQAIENASGGDSILVGPGRYGDLNGDGDFDDPGEEDAKAGCGCMILIDKRLTLISMYGAAMTLLDAAKNDVDVVRITADKVILGLKNRGFTLTGAGGGIPGDEGNFGLNVIAADVKIMGNLARGNTSAGFLIGDASNVKGHTVKDNVATGNGAAGFSTRGAGHNVRNNVANANLGSGFSIFGDGKNYYRDNVSVGNGSSGFTISLLPGASLRFYKNISTGNTGAGIAVRQVAEDVEIHKNNIFGNLGSVSSPQPNCGLANLSFGNDIDATRNYWGAVNGPGADPADNAGPGSGCDQGGITRVKPALRHPVRIHSYHRFEGHYHNEFNGSFSPDFSCCHYQTLFEMLPEQYPERLRE